MRHSAAMLVSEDSARHVTASDDRPRGRDRSATRAARPYGRAVAMLALLVLSSQFSAGVAAGSGGSPSKHARGGGGDNGGSGRSAAAHGTHHDAEDDNRGLIIEGEGEEEDAATGREQGVATKCMDLEFPEEMIADALQLAAQGRGEEGLECLRRGASLDPPPEFAEYFDALATLEEQNGDADAAREALEHALKLEPEYAFAILRLGNWYGARGQDDEAIAYFQRTSEIRPDSPVPYNNLGLAHMRLKDKAAAIEAFEEGLRIAQEPQGKAMLYNNLGIVYRDTGERERAIEVFRLAQKAAPSVEAAINIASTLSDEGLFEQAEAEIREGLKLQEHPTGLRVLSAALAFQDRLIAAAQVITDADLKLDERRRLLSEVAHEMAGKGKGEEAVELMSAAASELSEAEDWYHLGLMLVEMHRNRLGMRAYQTALRLDSSHERCLSAAAVHLYKLGKFSDAEKMFERQTKVSTDTQSLSDAYNGLGAAIEMTHSRLERSVFSS